MWLLDCYSYSLILSDFLILVRKYHCYCIFYLTRLCEECFDEIVLHGNIAYVHLFLSDTCIAVLT